MKSELNSYPRIPLSEFTEKDVPMLLLPYQQRWLADLSAFKNYTKSRRIGISWADASGAALLGAQENGSNTFYMGYEKEMARGYVGDAADWAKLYNLAASEIEEDEEVFRDGDEEKSIQVFRIYFNSGYFVEALSSKPRNMRSRQGDLVIDEAAFHDDLPGLLKAAKAMRVWGAKIRLITTYNGTDEPYYELDKDVVAGKLPYSRHFTTFLEAVAQGLYKRICLMRGKTWSPEIEKVWVEEVIAEFGDDADEELFCIPRQGGGRYLPRIIVEQCMTQEIPILTLSLSDDFVAWPEQRRVNYVESWLVENVLPLLQNLNSNLNSYFGMDFARLVDLSVLLPIQEMPNLGRRSGFGLEMRKVPYEQQRQALFFIVDRLPKFAAGALDARGNGGYLAEVAMQRYGGTRIHSIQPTQPWYSENFPKYKAALEDRGIELPASSDWLTDHQAVELVAGVPKVSDKRTKGTDGKMRHGDSAIAGVMAWFASLNPASPIEFQSLGQQRAGAEAFGLDVVPGRMSLRGYA